ncbi:hypothetical protein BU17DRAFT_70857 [Hysterangium stoloniferum]|nr:hypothetical protein BU17DRAFT_70857 [Hysterangium stoloniferum]
MFAWGDVLVWGEIGGTNSTARGHTACHQGHAVWASVLARRLQVRPCPNSKPCQTLHYDGRTTKFPTVPSQLQPLLIVDKVPEALSFAHCVLSKPMQGLEKETKKEMQQMQQDKRVWAPAPCPQTLKQSVPARFEAVVDTPTKYAVTTDAVCCNASTYKLARKQNRVSDFSTRFGFGFEEVGRLGE